MEATDAMFVGVPPVKFAAEAIKHPVPYEPKNLGPNINTPRLEDAPYLTPDGLSLYFVSREPGTIMTDIYTSRRSRRQQCDFL